MTPVFVGFGLPALAVGTASALPKIVGFKAGASDSQRMPVAPYHILPFRGIQVCGRDPRPWDPRLWDPRLWDPRLWDPRLWDPRLWDPRLWDPTGILGLGILGPTLRF